MPKYDWVNLKSQFIIGKWATIADFFREQDIKNNSYSRRRTKGWLEDRRQYQEKIIMRTQKIILEDEARVRSRQQKMALMLQKRGIEKLKNVEVESVSEARKILVDGLEQERMALGLDGKSDETSPTQVTAPLPKTKYDEFLEKATFEELVIFIAELKKLGFGKSDKEVTK